MDGGEKQALVSNPESTESIQPYNPEKKHSQNNQSPKYLPYIFFCLSVLCAVAGIYLGQVFVNAKYDVNDSYDAVQFWALVGQTFLLPVASLFIILFGLHSHKSEHIGIMTKMALYSTAFFTLIILASVFYASNPSDGTLSCAVFFCIWSGAQDPQDESGYRNVQTLIYMSMFWIFIAMFVFLQCRTFLEMYHTRAIEQFVEDGSPRLSRRSRSFLERAGEFLGLIEKEQEEQADGKKRLRLVPSPEERATERAKDKTKKTAIVIAGFLIFYPLIVLLCLSLPDSFESFTVSRIQSYASSNIPSTWGKVWDFKIDAELTLKLYPDILAFFLFIYLVAIVGLVAQAVPAVKRFFHSTPKQLGGLTVGDISLGATFAALLVGEFCYWYFYHGWEEQEVDSVARLERFARSIGQVASACCGLLVLPVARNSLWSHVFGVSWEGMIKFHRWAGTTMVLLVLTHGISWLVFYAKNNLNILVIPSEYHTDNFTIQLSAISTVFMMISMGILTFEWIRRNHFEVFYYAHHVFIVVFGVMLYHAASAWYYMLAGLSLYMLDRAIRFVRGNYSTKCTGVEVIGGVTKLSYVTESGRWMFYGDKLSKMKHKMGQYCFINIPAISVLEWHPFTISSAPSDIVLTHHIKSMGPDSFTDKLQRLAHTLPWNEKNVDLLINVDGPYGVEVDFEKYQKVILVAGGIGVTPLNSCVRELYGLAQDDQLPKIKQVHLVWVARSKSLFSILHDTLSEIDENDLQGKFSYSLYSTQSDPEDVGYDATTSSPKPETFVVKEGRPDLKSEITSNQEVPGSSSLVFACGPESLIKECQAICHDLKFEFHSETFLL